MVDKKIQKQFKELLSRESLKMTSARLSVLDDILSSDEHRECEEIFTELKSKGIKISRATTYRTLDFLVKYEYVRKLDIGDGKIRYEKKLGNPHHDHMICIETGDIIEFYNDAIETLQDRIALNHGYEIVRHVHQLFVKPIKKSK
jgi:Fur family ferric uptake transcriptional regulator